MSTLLYGFDPHTVQKLRTPAQPCPELPTKKELLRIGIPAAKIERVREELARLATADPALQQKAMLLKLAKQLQKQFV